jgi:AraC family transcriptional regulator
VDEAQRLCGVVLESLDQEQDTSGLARHTHRSRTQFYRVFQAMIEETPVAMRRRLLLERAAWQLSRTQLSVTDISLNANYGSLEALTRALRRAFRVSPSLYRRMGATYTHLQAANGIHHHSGKDDTKGACQFMDLFDIFSGQESWHTRRLLDLAKTLKDEQLDRPLKNQVNVFPWDGPDQTLRQMLDRMVQTKEAWAAALTGGSMPPMDNAPPTDRTPSAMLARLDRADAKFHGVLTDVRNRSAWDDTFVDALCEPPETFHIWRYVRPRDYVQCPQAYARNGRAATTRGQGRRFWLSHRIRREPRERVRPVSTHDYSRVVAKRLAIDLLASFRLCPYHARRPI